MALRVFRCKKCGQMVMMLKKSKCDMYCCEEAMEELIPGTTDAAVEKHVPVYEVKDNKVYVTVGDVIHPMMEQHYIEWIVLETKNGIQKKDLTPEDEPKAIFPLMEGDSVIAVYEYCNLHGLWRR
ncbi:MAG: desulfoferrodoxin family protein [Anaeroplasma sp.]|uniref:desulfoferrodoxin family protein n=1 Tax=Anaeroplasma sp. TaxID=1872523 RepID=UPI002A920AEA|nr:desulfoferrodoxin family protein [Anaeroplasma sp.]MDY5982382.1 desulfoferrodoxin family protein [Anaeroplasma sp.]